MFYLFRFRATCPTHLALLHLISLQQLKFERKIFRRIYGPKYENGERKIRTNRELEEMSKGENIVKNG